MTEPAALKILHVVPSLDPSRGGPSRSVKGLADALSTLTGVEVSLVAGGPAAHKATAGSAAVSQAPHLPMPFELPGLRLMKVIDAAIARADLVHLHSIWNGTTSYAAWQARRQQKISVLSPRGMLDVHNMQLHQYRKAIWRTLTDNRTLQGLSAYHFLDDTEYEGCAWLKSSRTKPRLIQSNGLDLSDLKQRLKAVDQLPAPSSFDPNRVNLVFVGRLNAIKGLELQLELLARLAQQSLDVVLHLIGPDDGELPKLVSLASRLGIANRLKIHGAIYGDERLFWLRHADAVLLTSHYECNSMTALETLATGGALVATRSCHLDKANAAGAAIVVPRTLDDLAAGVLRAIGPDRPALQSNARSYSETSLDWPALSMQMLAFYRELLRAAPCAV